MEDKMKNDNNEKNKTTKKETLKKTEKGKNTVEEMKEEINTISQINTDKSYSNDTKSTIYLGFYSRYILYFLFLIH